MKLDTIILKLSHTLEEQENGAPEITLLTRDSGKEWSATEDGKKRGLFPSELYLAHRIQTNIIQSFSDIISGKREE